MDVVKKQQSAHSLIEIFAAPPKSIQGGGLLQQFFSRKTGASAFEGLVAKSGIAGGNDADQVSHTASERDIIVARTLFPSSFAFWFLLVFVFFCFWMVRVPPRHRCPINRRAVAIARAAFATSP